MTTTTYSGSYAGDAFASFSSTEMSEDEVDITMMVEATRDFDEGRGAPVERVLEELRRERRQRAAASEATPSRT